MQVLQYRNNDLGLRPLTARSVVLSTLLGTHPPQLSVRQLVRAGELFGISEGTVRVALSRMVADGDLVPGNGDYRLTDRLVVRQARQDESRAPRVRQWRGAWEMAVVRAASRPATGRVALRSAMRALRFAELREGVWLRPDNLVRSLPSTVADQCLMFRVRPEADADVLASYLWNLDAWAARANHLLVAMRQASGLREAFMVAAAVLRHFLSDPVLPPELLPTAWPGTRLRTVYERFEARYRGILDERLGV